MEISTPSSLQGDWFDAIVGIENRCSLSSNSARGELMMSKEGRQAIRASICGA